MSILTYEFLPLRGIAISGYEAGSEVSYAYQGLHSWTHANYLPDGLTNAAIMTPDNIVDPLNNFAISMHQYVDWNGSATSPIGQDRVAFVSDLSAFFTLTTIPSACTVMAQAIASLIYSALITIP